MLAALEANSEIVTKNYTIFGSLDSMRMINSERCECIRRDAEFAELCKAIECEITDEEEEQEEKLAGRTTPMPWIRPAANNDEAGPSDTWVINISSDEEWNLCICTEVVASLISMYQ